MLYTEDPNSVGTLWVCIDPAILYGMIRIYFIDLQIHYFEFSIEFIDFRDIEKYKFKQYHFSEPLTKK